MSCKSKGFDIMLTTIVGTGVICKIFVNLAVGGLTHAIFIIIKKKLKFIS
jgi:hypothetical protein